MRRFSRIIGRWLGQRHTIKVRAFDRDDKEHVKLS